MDISLDVLVKTHGKSWDAASGVTGSGNKFYHNFIPGSAMEPEPFYMAIVAPSIQHCAGGLEIDADSAVISNKTGRAIPGVYRRPARSQVACTATTVLAATPCWIASCSVVWLPRRPARPWWTACGGLGAGRLLAGVSSPQPHLIAVMHAPRRSESIHKPLGCCPVQLRPPRLSFVESHKPSAGGTCTGCSDCHGWGYSMYGCVHFSQVKRRSGSPAGHPNGRTP